MLDTMPPRTSAANAVTVRPALERDLPLIASLASHIWPICFSGILTQEQIRNILKRIYSLQNLKQETLYGHRFWITSVLGQPVGYVSAYKEKGTIWLKKLYLYPAAHGKGIGRRMMETAVASFKPAHEIRLLVHSDNLMAQAFYEHMGFIHIGEEEVMMGDFAFTDYLYSKSLA
jgi:ribosomal protein S18 acetylase RimI-like enzyme